MRRAPFLLLMIGLIAQGAMAVAQAPKPIESVTVTGTKSREVLRGFVQSFAVPTRLTGKLARWDEGICPVTTGLRPEFARFIDRRLKDIAAQVGAPVNADASCKPNMEIVFTTTPQALVDNIRKKQPVFLGYADNTSQLEKLASVSHPIQAWYMTTTRDVEGGMQIDSAKPAGLINQMEFPCALCAGGKMVLYPDRVVGTTGSRLGDGLRSGLHNVVIVADPTRLASYEIGALSDYIAMLALAQLSSWRHAGNCPAS